MPWSLTKLKTSELCGAKYDFKYNQRLPDTPSDAAQRGTDIHKTLEGFVRGTVPTLTGPLEFYYGFLSALKASPVPLQTEYRIALRRDWSPCPDGEEPWYVGFIDLFRTVEVSAHFWDWKTGKHYPGHMEDMEVYALAIFSAHPQVEVVTGTYTYVDKGQNRERVFSRQFEYDGLKQKWDERAKKMENMKQFIPNPQFLCRYCAYSRGNGGPCQF